jgi:hydroxyacylglutathione hydrolase
MLLRQITDPKLAQHAYLVGCPGARQALVVDPLRDVDQYIEAARRENLRIVAVTETHIHADFLSGTRELAERTGARIYLSAAGGPAWSYRWNEGRSGVTLLDDGDEFMIGNVIIRATRTPGHTPEHITFTVTDGAERGPMGVITGDFVFAGDLGRPDLLESAAGEAGSREAGARDLFRSVDRLIEWPDWMQVWPGHGAGSACGKAMGAVPQTTAGYEKRFNDSVRAALDGEEAFVRAILDGQNEPPLYFARMKRLNRDGVPPLRELPKPRRLEAAELAEWAGRRDAYVLDARTDRSAFMRRHLPGSLFTPMNRAFNTAAGSLVADPELPILLILDDGRVEEAVRDLVRVGLDEIVAQASPETLEAHFAAGGAATTIDEIGMRDLESRRGDAVVLDVRYGPEFEAGHVTDAIHVPYTRLAARLDEVPRDRPVLVHCETGARSANAASLLAREGFDVTYVNGRLTDWRPAAGVTAVSTSSDL